MDIASWLRDVQDALGPQQQSLPLQSQPRLLQDHRKLKRKRSSLGNDIVHLTSPPDSQTSQDTPPPSVVLEMSSKKRKTGPDTPTLLPSARDDDGDDDGNNSSSANGENITDEYENEHTPRPPRRRYISSNVSSLSSARRSTNSGHSGASSPRKHLAAMALSHSGVQIQAMSDPLLLPGPLAAIRSRLMQCARGRGIIGASAMDSLSATAPAGSPHTDPETLHPDLEVLQTDREFYSSSSRDELGSTPTLHSVLYILECAADCLRMDRSEPAWNNEVHFPLLSLALRPRVIGSVFKNLVNVTTCSTASIIQEYRTLHAPHKKIDFCVYIDPQYDSDSHMASLIDNLRVRLPLLSINLTDDLPLLCHPIAIPIETKRPGEGLDTANLQIATWLSSHFLLLQRLLDLGSALPPDDDQPVPTLDDIGFIPGLIVQGNVWNFVAATRKESRTVVWSGVTLGSTGDILGIYQVVAALQILGSWVTMTYWPWLCRVIRRAAAAGSG